MYHLKNKKISTRTINETHKSIMMCIGCSTILIYGTSITGHPTSRCMRQVGLILLRDKQLHKYISPWKSVRKKIAFTDICVHFWSGRLTKGQSTTTAQCPKLQRMSLVPAVQIVVCSTCMVHRIGIAQLLQVTDSRSDDTLHNHSLTLQVTTLQIRSCRCRNHLWWGCRKWVGFFHASA